MSKATEARDEIQEALDALAPVHEGLRDYARVNLKPEAKAEIDKAIAVFDARVAALTTARTGLDALIANGHPDVPAREILAAAYADLEENKKTIEAAFALFRPDTARSLSISAGEPQPK